MNNQNQLLETAANQGQEARSLISEYDGNEGKEYESNMVRCLTSLINAIYTELLK